jgi:FlaA1/EpsC-like NDP-sugar epimerase
MTTHIRAMVMRHNRAFETAVQLFLIVASHYIAFKLRFGVDPPDWAMHMWWQVLPWLVALRVLTFLPFRLNEEKWPYASVDALLSIVGAVAISTAALFAVLHTPLFSRVYPRSILVIDAMLLTLSLGGIRLLHRMHSELTRLPGQRILIFGAAEAVERTVRNMKANPECSYQPVGLLDDDAANVGRVVQGVPVLGTRRDLRQILKKYQPAGVLIASPYAEPALIRSIACAFEEYKDPMQTMSNVHDTAERLFRCDGCGWCGWILPPDLDEPRGGELVSRVH